MNKNSKIFIAGHKGLVGSALLKKLQQDAYTNLVYRTSKELDLTEQNCVDQFFYEEKLEYVFVAAAKVGGINANNTYRADFLYKNLMIECNIIHASYKYRVKKLLFLGSSCIYPKDNPVPVKEEYLMNGDLEYTNKPYAIAKIAGIELCNSYRKQYDCNFICLMPTNLYGPNDNYDLNDSHVMPALLRKFTEALKNNSPSITLWGSGNAMREFLHSDDVADACVYFMNTYNGDIPLNIGTGKDISIKELTNILKEVTGYKGEIIFDTTKPDGTMRKVLDVSKANDLGWKYKIPLLTGIKKTFDIIKEIF